MLVSAIAFSQWFPHNIDTTWALNCVYFIDVNHGLVGGEFGTILKTNNAGISWYYFNYGSVPLRSIYSTDIDTSYMVGDFGTIIKTTDAGIDWFGQTSGTNYNLYSIYFLDANIGYVVGGNYNDTSFIILKTTNAGINWFTQFSGSPAMLKSCYFTDVNNGYGVGYDGLIIKTTDGGLIWTFQTSGTNNELNSVFFTDANTGYVVGGSGTILKTTDAGINWFALTSGTTQTLNSVYFTNANTGYIGGNAGKIYKTTNAGINWAEQVAFTGGKTVNCIYFPTNNTGYAAGDSGTILKTTNGGNWIEEDKNSSNNLELIYPNPTQDEITINLQGFQNLASSNLFIYNTQDQLLLQQKLKQDITNIDISQFPQGVYIAKIKMGDGSFVQKKFVVVR